MSDYMVTIDRSIEGVTTKETKSKTEATAIAKAAFNNGAFSAKVEVFDEAAEEYKTILYLGE